MVASAPPPKLFTQTLCWGLETEKNQIQFCLGVVHFSRELILLIAVSHNHLSITLPSLYWERVQCSMNF